MDIENLDEDTARTTSQRDFYRDLSVLAFWKDDVQNEFKKRKEEERNAKKKVKNARD